MRGVDSGQSQALTGMTCSMSEQKTILLGGGCFWCTEAVFKLVNGVKSVLPGYAGGRTQNPTYEAVCEGNTGHAEVVRVEYDPRVVTLESLLDLFLKTHDPTSLNKQGNDVGTQYRSFIGVATEAGKVEVNEYLKKKQVEYTEPIVTEVVSDMPFYEAENYHHDYFAKNPDAAYCQWVVKPKVEKAKKFIGME